MTALDVSGLEAIKAKKPRPQKAAWVPLDLADLKTGVYLAADPSERAFGLVIFEVMEDNLYGGARCSVHAAETFRTSPLDDVTGWEDLLLRIGMIEGALGEWIARWAVQFPDAVAVHEMPPLGGGRLANPEVALLASYAFRSACGHIPRLPMVPRQQHAKMICGNANAKKPVYHAILKEKYFPEIDNSGIVTNEATRDALCVALYAAQRGT